MSAVLTFPSDEARRHTKRVRLAEYLRKAADLIDADDLEINPTAALIVLTGAKMHEVVCCGYADDDWGFEEAGRAACYVVQSSHFPTVGRNRRERGDYVARPLRHDNIVDGAFPRTACKDRSDV